MLFPSSLLKQCILLRQRIPHEYWNSRGSCRAHKTLQYTEGFEKFQKATVPEDVAAGDGESSRKFVGRMFLPHSRKKLESQIRNSQQRNDEKSGDDTKMLSSSADSLNASGDA